MRFLKRLSNPVLDHFCHRLAFIAGINSEIYGFLTYYSGYVAALV